MKKQFDEKIKNTPLLVSVEDQNFTRGNITLSPKQLKSLHKNIVEEYSIIVTNKKTQDTYNAVVKKSTEIIDMGDYFLVAAKFGTFYNIYLGRITTLGEFFKSL